MFTHTVNLGDSPKLLQVCELAEHTLERVYDDHGEHALQQLFFFMFSKILFFALGVKTSSK
jgi:hypothetical protein